MKAGLRAIIAVFPQRLNRALQQIFVILAGRAVCSLGFNPWKLRTPATGNRASHE